uniref:Ionotropic receptor 5 n=1 Tax=Holotrichia parallela TaxID=93412 RepID=A0A2P9JY88_HOLPA|nr:ionotropic receptor 5 [Holotrichia parallela]
MGPFQWTVWLTLTVIYLFAIFPLAFSDKHTLKHLITKPQEMENMFWYVFGTFTNCFTFGKDTWTKSEKVTPRLLMGFYWIFTTIITACYTGSIIAFITIPIFPTTVDTVQQLLSGRFQIGTLDKGGWEYWFRNSSDKNSQKLLKNIEFLPNTESGLANITKAFFWPYAFLGSRAQLDYIVQTNFTTTNKKSLFHISTECFAPFGVSVVFGKYSIYKDIIDKGISYIAQSGFIIKFEKDIRWDFIRSPTGKLLQASSASTLKLISVEDRSLTLDDTQGTFLLLFAGFIAGMLSLMFESLGGCFKCFNKKRLNTASSIFSNPRSHGEPTPREKLDSIQYSCEEFPILNNLQDNMRNKTNIDAEMDNMNHINNDLQKSTNLICRNYNFDNFFGDENLNNQHATVEESN